MSHRGIFSKTHLSLKDTWTNFDGDVWVALRDSQEMIDLQAQFKLSDEKQDESDAHPLRKETPSENHARNTR